MNKILFVSPTFFDKKSVIGGGERYPIELAKTLAAKKGVKFITFGNKNSTKNVGGLKINIYKPTFFIAKSKFHPISLK